MSPIEGRILGLLGRLTYGLTIEDVSSQLGISRPTAAKYLFGLEKEGKIATRLIGKYRLHYPKGVRIEEKGLIKPRFLAFFALMFVLLAILAMAPVLIRVPSACSDSDGLCTASNMQSAEGTTENVNMNNNPFGWINITDWDIDVGQGNRIDNITLTIMWLTDNVDEGAGESISDIFFGFNNTSTTYRECAGPFGEQLTAINTTCDLTYNLTLEQLNSVKIRMRGNANNVGPQVILLRIDYASLNVTYSDLPPQWSDNKTNITSSYVEGYVSEVNVTWTDFFGINYTTIEMNITGSALNYTTFNTSDEYFVNFTAPAGTFYWRAYANDSNSSWNSTPKFIFTVNKADTNITLLLNGTRGNRAYNRTQTANLTAALNVSSKVIAIFTNYTGAEENITNATTPVTNMTNTTNLNAAVYRIKANWTGDQNYTEDEEIWFLTVNPIFLEVNLTRPVNGTRVSQNRTFEVNATVTCRNGDCGNVNGTLIYVGGERPVATSNFVSGTGEINNVVRAYDNGLNDTTTAATYTGGIVPATTYTNFTFDLNTRNGNVLFYTINDTDSAETERVECESAGGWTLLGNFFPNNQLTTNSSSVPSGCVNSTGGVVVRFFFESTLVEAYNYTLYDVYIRTEAAVDNVTEDRPFYIVNDINTKDCSTNPLSEGEFCNITWTVNTTGEIGSNWDLDVRFLSSSSLVSGNTTSNATVTIITGGTLVVELVSPPDPTNVAQNRTFLVNATVICRNGSCGNVQSFVRYNASGNDPNTQISTATDTTPFWVNSSYPQPQSCPTNPLDEGEFCNITWRVNATGDIDSVWKIGANFSSDAGGVEANHTNNSTVTIVQCFIFLDTFFTSIDFGNLDPRTENNSAPGNPTNAYNISANSSTTCNTNLYVRGMDLEESGGPRVIQIGNLTWNTTSSPAPARVRTDYDLLASNRAPSSNLTTYYWLTIPGGTKSATYNGNITILANYSGNI